MIDSAVLIKQGAEARVYELIPFLTNPNGCIVKERFSKTYRHPVLDKQLTHRRVSQEARCLFRCRKAGIDTPALYMVDPEAATIYMERILGRILKDIIIEGKADTDVLADAIGAALAKMHDVDVVHGDLTTSNLMLRDDNTSLVIIDFGLSYVSKLPEDKAVDLYVLERAFSSTHPQTEALFERILVSYKSHSKQAKPTLNKLEEVRLRGRKRSMLG
ncbi:kinase-like domain-containing protein [Umbelopsis sp. AD052]|nr:kinase-like domain-containing protein [Umbelopsis sp. AD052]